MAPFTFDHVTSILITLAIGFGFGFVLERAGFGNARNLAAQFYLHDMRVLKVMFTGIVTAMILVFLSSALGWLDFSRVWVPPTYFWPGIVGGFLLGVGFIIGGYCPGTSLVAVATFKIDGVIYSVGVLVGLFAFGETAPWFWGFFSHSGAMGRLTIFDWLGVDAGVVVLGVVVMALGAFASAEVAERLFARPDAPRLPVSPRLRLFRRAVVVAGLGLACATLIVGQPTIERKMYWAAPGLAESLRARTIHIDPAELLTLMHNNRIRLELIDVRSEADFNRFHLLDAKHVSIERIDARWAAGLPSDAVVVVMSNDERAANEAWRRLAVLLNDAPQTPVGARSRAYVLAGGINRWLDIYEMGQVAAPGPDVATTDDDVLRHRFAAAVGSREAMARPAAKAAPSRIFAVKVQTAKPVRQAGGGCG